MGMLLLIVIAVIGLSALFLAMAIISHNQSKNKEALEQLHHQLREALAHKGLLAQVLDNQSRAVFVTNSQDRIIYANRSLAQRHGKPLSDIVGKPLSNLFSNEQTRRYQQRNHETLSANAPMVTIDRSGDAVLSITQVQHIPLPISLPDEGPCVLITEEDISALVLEKQRRERTLRETVHLLVTLVDRRDPNAANHSIRVGKVAQGIAQEMGLDSSLVETAETAGELMNLGKIFVPLEILLKTTPYTDEDRKLMNKFLHHAAELLTSIEFDGPVAQTLMQCQEHYDGTGWPDGWKGEDIIAPARVIAAANAFVALVSPRAHRPGMTVDQAVMILRGESNTTYDPRVLNALETYLNTGGRMEWQMTSAARA